MPLIPFISINFNTPVWRTEIDETTDMLFLEIRDIADKQVSFAGVNLNTGFLNFKGLTMPERWLSGLEAAHNGVMLVNGFQGETVPVHKGLTGINAVTGEVIWSDYNINFERKVPDGFVVADARFRPKKMFVTDAKNGESISGSDPLLREDQKSAILYPQSISPGDIPFVLNKNTYGNEVHYLNHNTFRIVSLHALSEGVLTQHLYVLNETGEVLFTDIIAGGIQKLQPEAFISYKNKLIWLQNRSVLKVLNL